jgi:hypothetical protein
MPEWGRASQTSLLIMESLISIKPLNHFQSLWLTLVSLCDHVSIAFGSVWVHFGITLGSFCGQFIITLGSFWIHFGITLVSLWLNVVTIRNKIGNDLGRLWAVPHDVPVHFRI